MNRSEREQEYAAILDSLQKIRAGIVNDSQQELMFTGMMPPEAQKELKVVADITASVFMGLAAAGVQIGSDPSNPALAVMNIGGRSYSCLKAQLNGANISSAPAAPVTPAVQETPVAPLSAPEVKPAPVEVREQKTVPVAPVAPAASVVEETPVQTVKEALKASQSVPEPVVEPKPAPVPAPAPATAPIAEDNNNILAEEVEEEAEPEPVSQSIDDFLPKDQVTHTQMSAEEYARALLAAEIGSDAIPETPAPAPAPVAAPEPREETPAPMPAPKPAPAPAPAPVSMAEHEPDPDPEPEPEVYAPVATPMPPKRPAAPVPMEAQGVVSLSDGEDDDSSTIGNEPVEAAPVTTGKAKIIGGAPTNISMGIAKDEFFIDEQSKLESEFVYCFSKLSVMHTDMGGGGRPEEMLVMIAPLKIYKYSQTSVPIVVTIVHNGKSVTASSYDILEEGKNIVTIDIDEFYFLCRGSFDDKGKFKASIVTTGISSQQNDRITPLFSKTYGNGTAKETRNGHIKFHYTADSGPGSVEVIPFGVQGDRSEDFVAIIKNTEFVDYYLVSKSLKANTRAIIYSEGGVMNELVCHWEDDTLIADLI